MLKFVSLICFLSSLILLPWHHYLSVSIQVKTSYCKILNTTWYAEKWSNLATPRRSSYCYLVSIFKKKPHTHTLMLFIWITYGNIFKNKVIWRLQNVVNHLSRTINPCLSHFTWIKLSKYYKEKIIPEADGNTGPKLGQAHKCGRI